MSGPLNLDYFYGIQADQFEYYRIPKLLITDKRYNGISSDAKILYGVLLDRMSLSLKNKWIDEQNRVFIIYSIKEICEKLECSKDKAMYVMAELDNSKGIGLIEKAKRGLGLPDIIYVKNFATLENKNIVRPAKKPTIPVKKKQEGNKTDAYKCQVRYGKVRKEEVVESQYQEVEDIPHPEVGNLQPPEVANLQPPEVANLRPPEVANLRPPEVANLRPPEVANLRPQRWQISDPNNNYINNNNINNSDVNNPFLSFHFQNTGDGRTEWNGTDSSAPIELVMEKRKKINSDSANMNDAVSDKARESDVLMMKEKYVRLLKKQVFYDDLMKMDNYESEKPTIDGIINMIADIATTVPPDNAEWVNSRPYNHEVVKSHLLKLNYHSLLDALRRLKNNNTNVHKHRSYLLTTVYNAIDQHDFALSCEVQYDMHGRIKRENNGRGDITK